MDAVGSAPLRIGMIGSGFMARFHLQAMIGVRDAVMARVQSDAAPRGVPPAGQRARSRSVPHLWVGR